MSGGEKVLPLGLNFQVNDSARDMFRVRRAAMYGGAARVKTMLKALRFDDMLGAPEIERLDKALGLTIEIGESDALDNPASAKR